MPASRLPRTLGLFDATMIVMGGIVGSGIFINPYVVAERVHTPFLILGAWMLGGLLALAGAFIWAELACRVPEAGGQYLYLREAYGPAIAFLYGWVLLLVIQTGGTAAVAVTFARYAQEFTGMHGSDSGIACVTLLALAAINCLGARSGSNVQSVLMLLKSAAIGTLVVAGFSVSHAAAVVPPAAQANSFGAAMIPIAFAYGGWQTASFLAGEMRDPRRDLARGLILGVLGVIALYLAVNYVCVRALGPEGLAATRTPASSVMRAAWGPSGARLIALGIAISTLGFLGQAVLTAPRVYYAMAKDRLFFRSVAWISPRTGAPVVAILVQALLASIIVFVGRYDQILNYVVSIDFIFFTLTAATIFIFRRRSLPTPLFRTPGHPFTTGLFVLASAAIVLTTFTSYPANSLIGLVILLAGVPVYWFWKQRKAAAVLQDNDQHD